MMTATAIETCW